MSANKKKKVLSHIGKAFIIALLLVFIVRVFIVESFTISSSQMDTALVRGDKVFVDKTSYGVRMPMTVLSLPFTFDSIFGFKSYSNIVDFDYRRMGEKMAMRSDIVLFNNPLETNKPLDKRSLLVSRCVAIASDTIKVDNGTLSVNGVDYIFSPDLMQEYLIANKNNSHGIDESVVNQIFTTYNIPRRNYTRIDNQIILQLSRYESFIFNQNLPDTIFSILRKTGYSLDYKIVVPYAGLTIALDNASLSIYGKNISEELGKKAKISDNVLYVNGVSQLEYTFTENYLWVLSDNTTNSIDSRSIGFIPFSHVIGRVGFIWSGSTDRTRDYNRFLNRSK